MSNQNNIIDQFINAELAVERAKVAVNDVKRELIEQLIAEGRTDLFKLDLERIYRTQGMSRSNALRNA